MEPAPNFWKSRKALIGLIYVGLALILVGQAGALTQQHIELFSSAGELRLTVQSVRIHVETRNALVTAFTENPTGFSGLQLFDAIYSLFINSTTTPFLVQGSSEIGLAESPWNKAIPPHGSVNITYTLPLLGDVIPSLTSFLNDHSIDNRTFVGITIRLQSTLGLLSIPYCYEMPGQTFTICPSTRTTGSGGGGGA